MAEQSAFDVVIVGGGPGGYPAAIRAAQYGLRVALIEKERPGGVCLNWGCIPTKAMLRSAEVLETMQHSADFGVLADNVRLDYPAVLKRKDAHRQGPDRRRRPAAQGQRRHGLSTATPDSPPAHALDVVGVGKSPLGAGGPLYNAPADAGRPAERARRAASTSSSPPARRPPSCRSPARTCPASSTRTAPSCSRRCPKRIVIVGGGAVGTEWATHVFGLWLRGHAGRAAAEPAAARRRGHGPRAGALVPEARHQGPDRLDGRQDRDRRHQEGAGAEGHHHRQGRQERADRRGRQRPDRRLAPSEHARPEPRNDRRRRPTSAATSPSTISCAPTCRTCSPSATWSARSSWRTWRRTRVWSPPASSPATTSGWTTRPCPPPRSPIPRSPASA